MRYRPITIPKVNDPQKFDALPFIGNLVFALHIPLDAAWDFSFKEYYAVINAVNGDSEQPKKGEFDEEELAVLEQMRSKLKGL